MLIDAVLFAGEDRRAGVAVKTWKRRTGGGAIQKKHSLALVRGWLSVLIICYGK